MSVSHLISYYITRKLQFEFLLKRLGKVATEVKPEDVKKTNAAVINHQLFLHFIHEVDFNEISLQQYN